MSKGYLDRNQQNNTDQNTFDVNQKKIDPVAQLKWINSQHGDNGFGIYDDPPKKKVDEPVNKDNPVEIDEVVYKQTNKDKRAAKRYSRKKKRALKKIDRYNKAASKGKKRDATKLEAWLVNNFDQAEINDIISAFGNPQQDNFNTVIVHNETYELFENVTSEQTDATGKPINKNDTPTLDSIPVMVTEGMLNDTRNGKKNQKNRI